MPTLLPAPVQPEIVDHRRISEREGATGRLLRQLVKNGLALDAVEAAAALICALESVSREDRELRLEQAREAGRRGAIERWRRARLDA